MLRPWMQTTTVITGALSIIAGVVFALYSAYQFYLECHSSKPGKFIDTEQILGDLMVNGTISVMLLGLGLAILWYMYRPIFKSKSS